MRLRIRRLGRGEADSARHRTGWRSRVAFI